MNTEALRKNKRLDMMKSWGEKQRQVLTIAEKGYRDAKTGESDTATVANTASDLPEKGFMWWDFQTFNGSRERMMKQ